MMKIATDRKMRHGLVEQHKLFIKNQYLCIECGNYIKNTKNLSRC